MKITASILLIVLFAFPAFVKAENPANNDTTGKKCSYYLQTSYGATILFGKTSLNSFSIVNGIRVNRTFALGLGANLEADANRLWLPVYLHFNVNLLKKRFTPVVIIECGSGVGLKSMQPLIYGSTQLGLSYYLNNKLGLLFAWGWKTYYAVENDNLFNGLVLRGGLTF